MLNQFQIDRLELIFQSDLVKISKILSNHSYYFYKTKKGSKQQIDACKHLLQRRMIDLSTKDNACRIEKELKVQFMQNKEYCLHIKTPWIDHQDIIKIVSEDKSAKNEKINQIICQFIAEIIVGPNQFVYSYESLLYNDMKEELLINYLSFSGNDFIKKQESISKKSLQEAIDSLAISKKANKIVALSPINKMRAIANLLLKMISQKREYAQPLQSQTYTLTQVHKHIQDYNEKIKKLIKILKTDQQNNCETKYLQFLQQLYLEEKNLKWNDVINLLIPQFNAQQQVENKELSVIFGKIGKFLFNKEDIYVRNKLIELGIVQQSQQQSYELYLKTKLASSKQQLLFLFKFNKLAHLFQKSSWQIYSVDNERTKSVQITNLQCVRKTAQSIYKSFLALIYESLKQEQQQCLIKSELALIYGKLLSKYGSQTIQHQNIELKYRSSENKTLNKYLKL